MFLSSVGEDVGSDHHLLMTKVMLMLMLRRDLRENTGSGDGKRWWVDQLGDEKDNLATKVYKKRSKQQSKHQDRSHYTCWDQERYEEVKEWEGSKIWRYTGANSGFGETLEEILLDLWNYIWSNEQVPEEWKKGLLFKLLKKGDLGHCKNWLGIMLVYLGSKVFCRVILERTKTTLDPAGGLSGVPS